MTSLVTSQLTGDSKHGDSAHEFVIKSVSPYRNGMKAFNPKFPEKFGYIGI
jgi:hypothetical protein